MPAAYMFSGIVPNETLAEGGGDRPFALDGSQRWICHGVAVGLISVSADPVLAERAMTEYPGRFVGSWTVDPNEGMAGIRKLVDACARWDIRAVSFFPHMVQPQVAIDAALAYPVYAKCVELGLPIFITAGIAGPRVPSKVQHVELLDQIMYDFPELVVVMRHGAEPWVDLAIKLMIKWPNLHYSTTAFAPRFYPKQIVDYANTRGADRVLYGGYFPMGLSLERIMIELPDVPFGDEAWPKFLRGNAMRILKLEAR